ncbi:beta-N-acetylhexosaminidase [Paenibacillus nasutitermitis]|uniref:beta-N-acetylhexosaminidase n=1 Tax=Paenibacillus nasutitermitis TaxID=1652958 RepID=A0A917E0Y7_9BACL|nr:beta-N-acetylhexosaminidase [Paenibacillus nasutitermitis]GGD92990.1 glycoside hydrolase family 3 [Paenibacillus nasutitermitis]
MKLQVARAAVILCICFLAAGCANKQPGQEAGPPGAVEQQPDPNAGNSSGQPPNEGSGAAPDNGSNGSGNQQEASPGKLELQLKAMPLSEKLGQLIIAGVEGTSANDKTRRMISEEHVGGIIFYKNNLTDPEGVTGYVNTLKSWNRANSAPLFISVDEEGGRVSRLPGLSKIPAASRVGEADKPDYAARIGAFLGEACRVMGINMDYAPVLDINSNPGNPVIGDRSYGTTAELVTRTGMEVMNGMRTTGVIPVVKHFPGHGDTSVDSHLELPVVNKSLKELQALEWLPFREAVKQGADAVMVAHILFPKLDADYPASLSKTVITDELRGMLGFKGVVITDDLTMGAIAKHYGMGEAAVRSVKAGSDILLVAHGYENVTSIIQALKKSLDKGEITQERIDESVMRVLALKDKYKLTDEGETPNPDLTELNNAIDRTVASP